jgi:uncharacterized protein YecT (DUF1311 family)
MREFPTVCLLVFAAMGASARAEDTPAESLEDCHENQLAENVCARRAFDSADKTLNLLFASQLSQLESAQTKGQLRAAQRAWIAFRDADCLYQAGKPEDSGSIWPLLHWSCMAAHTTIRVEQLKQYVACTEDDCPR